MCAGARRARTCARRTNAAAARRRGKRASPTRPTARRSSARSRRPGCTQTRRHACAPSARAEATKETQMKPTKTIAALGLAAVTAAAAAGCGSSSNNSATASTAPPKTASGHAATVGLASTGLGKILVDSRGDTLYLFKKDAGTTSACSGACASAWPPLRATGKPSIGTGVNPSLVGTTPRSDGKPQVTYAGHPVYLYTGDQAPGDTSGQGVNAFGAAWFALSGSGAQVAGSAGTSGGGGY